VPGDQNPRLTIVKTATPAPVIATVGDVITYSYLVTNTGNVTLTDVTVDDTHLPPAGPLATGPTCPPAAASVAPGQTVTCTATYLTTQADIDNGRVNNTATATGQPPTPAGGPTPPPEVSPPSPWETPIPSRPSLAVVKDSDPDEAHKVGDTITYTYTVTNDGNVTQTDITVTDHLTAPAGPELTVTCPATTLAPAASMTCTAAPYRVTATDARNRNVSNTGTVSGQPPTPAGGTPPPRTTSTSNKVVVPVVTPALAVVLPTGTATVALPDTGNRTPGGWAALIIIIGLFLRAVARHQRRPARPTGPPINR
jgi:uncharacterized repeat protein (TIGR01451 family)